MAPQLEQVQAQTLDVLNYLFNDFELTDRCNCQIDGDIETDSDDFDPVLIADKLREVADALNANPKFQAQLSKLKQTAAQEALDAALTQGIDTLVQSQVGQRTEVAPELQLIKAAVAFGLYLKKTCPNLSSQLQPSIGNFINQRSGALDH
ncbi:hypothetical protein NQD34_003536 [Periophthalmus magnuspinnatus]|nr:hypothetical protein NQD34_003536 [Periophthalmus magnuspinnatus]